MSHLQLNLLPPDGPEDGIDPLWLALGLIAGVSSIIFLLSVFHEYLK